MIHPMLFDSFQLRTTALRNRAVMAPMTRSRAVEANTPNALMATYYGQRARPFLANPDWEIKWQVEQYIRALGLPFTVLRPTMFMENFADPTWGPTGEHSLLQQIPINAAVQLIALSDIGAVAALAFRKPEQYVGKAIELAGDELTVEQIVAAIHRATGAASFRVDQRRRARVSMPRPQRGLTGVPMLSCPAAMAHHRPLLGPHTATECR